MGYVTKTKQRSTTIGVSAPRCRASSDLYLSPDLCSAGPTGNLLIMHPSLMFIPEVKRLYNGLLSDIKSSVNLKIQVLKNLQMYLQEEDTRMLEADRECESLTHPVRCFICKLCFP